MSKKKIIGVAPVNYTNKNGEVITGLTLYLSGKTAQAFGDACCEVYVSGKSPIMTQFLPFASDGLKLVGKFVSLDNNNKGFLENLELLD